MTSSPEAPKPVGEDAAVDYLVVDRFLRSLVGARALKSAFELRVIEDLEGGPRTLAELASGRGDLQGMRLLVALLRAEGVVEETDGKVALAPEFVHALRYRDLLDTKLDFIGFVLLDFVDRFNSLIVDPDTFMRDSQVFRLFDYRRASEPGEDSYAWTKVWIRLTTALTRYESGACLSRYDFGRHRRMLDIGGNSGEFALRICRANPQLRATVMDLPVVCEFGQDHVLSEPERERISFVAGSALQKAIPPGHDLITFKSMLHDWQEPDVRRFLERAAEGLEPGGTLMIFERAPLELGDGAPPLSLLPILMFARFYRPAAVYERHLRELGLEDVRVQELELETRFFLVTATKPGS